MQLLKEKTNLEDSLLKADQKGKEASSPTKLGKKKSLFGDEKGADEKVEVVMNEGIQKLTSQIQETKSNHAVELYKLEEEIVKLKKEIENSEHTVEASFQSIYGLKEIAQNDTIMFD